MSDITQLILDDHETFRREFAALDDADAPEQLREIWEPLANLLEVHAAAEEAVFYPKLLRRSDDGEDETIDAIGDHNDIRDGVREAARHRIGSAQWWDGVRHARAANSNHMAEEEDEALRDFRRNTPLGVRVNLGHEFLKFKTDHSDAERLDTSDKDPQAYVSAIESEIIRWRPEKVPRYRQLEGTLMITDHLLRNYAPIPAAGWQQIDDEAKDRLTARLAARRLVDWSGPHGWTHSATNLGRTAALDSAPPGTKFETVVARQRRVLALTELRVSFTVECSGLQDAERGATDIDYGDLDRATHDAALIENRAVFHGWPEAGITGIAESSSHPWLTLGQDANTYPHAIANATNLLRQAGIEGPYALAVSPQGYSRIAETAEHGGYPLHEHLTKILGGDVVWAPGLDGALVVSKRGGDFILDVGQDFSIGYARHDAELVTLYLEESFNFRVTEPDAAVVLTEG